MEISKFTNWFKEYGWRHLVGLMFVTFAIYPILFVLTNSFADFANLTNSKLIPNSLTLKHYKLLSGDPLVPYFQWLYNTYKVAFLAALFNVFLGTLAAFAFWGSTPPPKKGSGAPKKGSLNIYVKYRKETP